MDPSILRTPSMLRVRAALLDIAMERPIKKALKKLKLINHGLYQLRWVLQESLKEEQDARVLKTKEKRLRPPSRGKR